MKSKFRKLVSVVKERRWVILAIVAVELALSPFLLKFARPTYEATAQVAYVSSGSATSSGVLPAADIPSLVLSNDVMARVAETLHLNLDERNQLELDTKTKATPKSNVVPISVRSKNESFAVYAANTIADQTSLAYQRLATQQYDAIIVRLREQLATERGVISTIDGKLQDAVQSDAAVGAPNALETLSTHLNDLETARAQAYATYVADSATAKSDTAVDASSRSGLGAAVREQVLTGDPVYSALAAQHAKDQADYETQKAGYTDAFPGLAGLKEKVSLEGAAVERAASQAVARHAGNSAAYAQVMIARQAAAGQAAGDSARVAAIDAEIARVRGHIANLPHSGLAVNQYRLQRDSAANAFQNLDNRLQSTIADRAQAASLGSVVVLDRAIEAPARIPRVVLDVLIAVLVLGFALGGAFLVESLDPRIRTTTDVESLYGSPHLGKL